MSGRIQCCIKLYTKLEKEQEKEKISGKEKWNPYSSWCQSNDKEADEWLWIDSLWANCSPLTCQSSSWGSALIQYLISCLWAPRHTKPSLKAHLWHVASILHFFCCQLHFSLQNTLYTPGFHELHVFQGSDKTLTINIKFVNDSSCEC